MACAPPRTSPFQWRELGAHESWGCGSGRACWCFLLMVRILFWLTNVGFVVFLVLTKWSCWISFFCFGYEVGIKESNSPLQWKNHPRRALYRPVRTPKQLKADSPSFSESWRMTHHLPTGQWITFDLFLGIGISTKQEWVDKCQPCFSKKTKMP